MAAWTCFLLPAVVGVLIVGIVLIVAGVAGRRGGCTCSHCGNGNRREARFCGRCGRALPDAGPHSDSEA